MPKIKSIEQTVASSGGVMSQPKMSPSQTGYGVLNQSVDQIGVALQQKADQDEKLRQANFMVDSQLQWEGRLDALKNEYPEGSGYTDKVLEEFEEFSNESLSNVKARYKADLQANLLNFKSKVLNNAISTEASLKTSYQKDKFEDQLNILTNRARASGYVDVDMYAALDEKIDLYDLSPDAKRGFKDALYNEVNAAYFQGLIERDPSAAVSELQSGNFDDLDSDVFGKLLTAAKATKKANAEKLEKIKFSDPVKYIQATQPELTNTNDLIEAQIKMGVPAADISVMTNLQAKDFAQKIKGSGNVDDFLAQREVIKQKYGDNYEQALGDIYKADLPMDYQLLFSMDENENIDQMQTMMKVVQAGGSVSSNSNAVISLAKAKAEANGDDFNDDIKNEVLSRMSETMAFLEDEGMDPQQRDTLNKSLIGLAAGFYDEGLDAGDAVEKAVEWINDSYEVYSVNGKDFRIPISDRYDADTVYQNLKEGLRQLDIKLPYEPLIAKGRIESLKETGYFVLNERQDGVYFVSNLGHNVFDSYDKITAGGIPVPAVDGNLVEFKFDDVFFAPDTNVGSKSKTKTDSKKLTSSEAEKIREAGKKAGLTQRQIRMEIEAARVRKLNKSIEQNLGL